MKIHHQGWNETVGLFNSDVTIDENKQDHEIHFSNGVVFRQQTPFRDLTIDWDQTGDPYSKTGAFFSFDGAQEFFTPVELAALALNGYARIPGIQIEPHQDRLADRILAAEQRTGNREQHPSHPAPSLSF